jgi:hypothetical protein
VDDAAEAVVKTLEAPLSLVGNQIFNVGSDEQNYTLQQVGEMIARLVPGAALVNEGSDTDPRDYRVSFAKIAKTFGFAPRWTIEQGVMQVMEAMASGAVNDYRDSKHSNVKFLGDEGASLLSRGQTNWARELLNKSSSDVVDGVAR